MQLGSVSEQCVTAMAAGARDKLGADIGVAVTGIAGPGGGSKEKPVGLVYLALVAGDGRMVKRFVWDGDRRQNKRRSGLAALGVIEELLATTDN